MRKLDTLSESRVQEICTPGLMSGIWKRGTPVLPRQISTLPVRQLPDGKDAGCAANGTLAFRAVAGFETKFAQVGSVGRPG